MYILAATQARQPDYVALAMVLVLLIGVAIMALRKYLASKKPVPQSQILEVPVQEPVRYTPVAPGSAGQVKIHNVPPKTAAMLMAIVADKMGRPLNELRFISIKEVTE